MGPWNKPERHFLARGFMPRKPVDRRRAERDSNGLPSGNIDLKQRKDWSIWADKMVSSRGIYNWLFSDYFIVSVFIAQIQEKWKPGTWSNLGWKKRCNSNLCHGNSFKKH